MAFLWNSKACRFLFVSFQRNSSCITKRDPTFCCPLASLTSSRNLCKGNVKSFDDIPGPIKIPLIGTAWPILVEVGRERLGKRLLALQQQDVIKYGKIHRHQFAGVNMIMLADPMDAAKVLRAEPKYPQRFRAPVLDYYREKRGKIPGVFFADGAEWYRHRSVLSKRMLRPKEVCDYSSEFNKIITDFINRLRTIRETSGLDRAKEVPGLHDELFKWSFESVAFMLFDKRFGCLGTQVNREADTFIKAVGDFLGNIISVAFVPLLFYKIYETKQLKNTFSNFDTMYEYAELFIERRIDELMAKSSESSDDNKAGFFEFLLSSGKVTKDDLIASVIDVLFAGVDTTSNTMQWVLYMMAKNPEKQEVLRQEVFSVLGDETIATPSTLAEMPYLKAWLRETLRMYPILSGLSRILSRDIILRGYRIPAGVQINVLSHCMSSDESIFPDAEKFKPERWLRDRKQFNDIEDVFASMPFGFGKRMCLGRRIAELELHLLLARIVQHFEIRYPPGEIVEPFVRGLVIPDRPLRVQFLDRKKA